MYDTRGAIDIDPKNKSEPIRQCVMCFLPIGEYYNCSLVECNKKFIACSDCLDKLENCCSKLCKNQFNKVKL